MGTGLQSWGREAAGGEIGEAESQAHGTPHPEGAGQSVTWGKGQQLKKGSQPGRPTGKEGRGTGQRQGQGSAGGWLEEGEGES